MYGLQLVSWMILLRQCSLEWSWLSLGYINCNMPSVRSQRKLGQVAKVPVNISKQLWPYSITCSSSQHFLPCPHPKPLPPRSWASTSFSSLYNSDILALQPLGSHALSWSSWPLGSWIHYPTLQDPVQSRGFQMPLAFFSHTSTIDFFSSAIPWSDHALIFHSASTQWRILESCFC